MVRSKRSPSARDNSNAAKRHVGFKEVMQMRNFTTYRR
jgi:hypothetical protein